MPVQIRVFIVPLQLIYDMFHDTRCPTEEMTRTFQHKFSLGAKSGLLLFTTSAVWLFWHKEFVLGLVLIVLNVVIMERVFHSHYIFRDGRLIIDRGRFGKTTEIPLASIHSCRPMSNTFGMVHYLLIGYGNQRVVAVEPDNEQTFVETLRKAVAAPPDGQWKNCDTAPLSEGQKD